MKSRVISNKRIKTVVELGGNIVRPCDAAVCNRIEPPRIRKNCAKHEVQHSLFGGENRKIRIEKNCFKKAKNSVKLLFF